MNDSSELTDTEALPSTTAEEPPADEASPPSQDDAPETRDATEPQPEPERPAIAALRKAKDDGTPVDGKVIGWNNGGLHVVAEGVTAFCPRSEIELGSPQEPENYIDQTFPFLVLRVQKRGRRVVLSRKAILQGERSDALQSTRQKLTAGEPVQGTVVSLADFGAFVDIGGVEGLVHVSEISRARVQHPNEVLSEGQEVTVKILKIDDGGKRISLSIKALEPDPWKDSAAQLPIGEVVDGVVERTAEFGAFIEVAPGLTGLLPTAMMNLPRDASPGRIYHPGKKVRVQVLNVDTRRRRISLALEGSQVEGTQADLESYRQRQDGESESFNALAAAFKRARGSS